MRLGIVGDVRAAETIKAALALRGEHQVVWVASSGGELRLHDAAEMPDLVVVSLDTPGLDGLEATRWVVRDMAGAALVAVSGQADPARVFAAIGHGAIDAIALPAGGGADAVAEVLLPKIASIARWIGKGAALPLSSRAGERQAGTERLIAIGASAGGPAALSVVLGALPRTLPASIVVVQHLGEDFTVGVAEWLRRGTALEVRVARENDRPSPGTVLVAGGNDHLVFKSGARLGYTAEPRDKVYRPSVDVFFDSVCRLWRGPVVGVLLTGMGRDGAQGLRALRGQGHHTIAQDEASCAVYGMPKAAAALNAAVDILPLDRIAPRLEDLVAMRVRPRRPTSR
jgi:two-component system, chemotaxis family, response regulator WspF